MKIEVGKWFIDVDFAYEEGIGILILALIVWLTLIIAPIWKWW